MPNWPDIVFWMLVMMGAGTASRWRHGRIPRGWLLVVVTILALALAGYLLGRSWLVGVAGGAWVLFVIVPSVLAHQSLRWSTCEHYGRARQAARLAAVFHPFDGWRDSPAMIDAVALAARGDADGAVALLEPLSRLETAPGERAWLLRCRLAQDWQGILLFAAAHPRQIERDAELLGMVVRALGETGDTAGMVDLCERSKRRIAGITLPLLRDSIRLPYFAFSGQPEATDRLFGQSFAGLPAISRAYWLATARLYGGEPDAARADFEKLLPEANEVWEKAIRRRITASHEPLPSLDAARRAFVAAEANRQETEIRFGEKRPPSAGASLVTWSLVALNGLAFALQLAFDGSTDIEVLHDLGALCADCVGRGEWWRLLTATFLHLGPLHLIMNLGALAILGPQAEAGLGRGRTLVVYFLAGVGSMAAVAAQSWISGERLIAVGASGAVMGLIGATAAMMLRGWFNEGAVAARNRALAMAGVVLGQMAIDTLVPQLSFTAHLSGAVIGFVTTLLLGDRLGRPAASPAARPSVQPPD
jgi:rhomboid protease GluP